MMKVHPDNPLRVILDNKHVPTGQETFHHRYLVYFSQTRDQVFHPFFGIELWIDPPHGRNILCENHIWPTIIFEELVQIRVELLEIYALNETIQLQYDSLVTQSLLLQSLVGSYFIDVALDELFIAIAMLLV